MLKPIPSLRPEQLEPELAESFREQLAYEELLAWARRMADQARVRWLAARRLQMALQGMPDV